MSLPLTPSRSPIATESGAPATGCRCARSSPTAPAAGTPPSAAPRSSASVQRLRRLARLSMQTRLLLPPQTSADVKTSAAGARGSELGAIRSGADRPVEMLAELGMVLTNPGHPLTDCTGDAGSGPLGRRCGASVAAMEADGAESSRTRKARSGLPALLARCPRERAPARCRPRSRRGAGGRRSLARTSSISPASPGPVRDRPAARPLSVPPAWPLSAVTRSSTWSSRPGSASDCARYRMPLTSRTRHRAPQAISVGATGFEPATARPPADTASLSIRPWASPSSASPFMHDLDA